MKFTSGKVFIALLILLSAGFVFTLLVSAGEQQPAEPDNEESGPVAVSWSVPESVTFAGEALPPAKFRHPREP